MSGSLEIAATACSAPHQGWQNRFHRVRDGIFFSFCYSLDISATFSLDPTFWVHLKLIENFEHVWKMVIKLLIQWNGWKHRCILKYSCLWRVTSPDSRFSAKEDYNPKDSMNRQGWRLFCLWFQIDHRDHNPKIWNNVDFKWRHN